MLMKNRINISDSVKSGVIHVVSSILSNGLAIITVPIFTRIMPSSEVGLVNLFISWYAILNGVVTLGLTSGGLTMSLKTFCNEKNQYLSSILSITTISALVVDILLFTFIDFFSDLFRMPTNLIVLMAVCFLFNPAYDFWLVKQRYEYKYKLSGTLMISSSILASLLAVLAVLKLPNDSVFTYAEARLFGTYSVTLSIALIIWLVIFIKGKTFVNIRYWTYSLKLSLPLVGQMLAVQILGFSDRIMIEKYCGKSQVGIYGTIYTIGTLTTMLWTAINGTFTPYIYKNIEENGRLVKKNSFLIILFFSLVSIIVVLFGPEIAKIVGPEEYYMGVYIIPPAATGVYLVAIGDLYSDLLIYAKKTKYIMFGTIIGATLNILLNAVFIPRYGYIVAAFTTLFSYIIMTIMLVFFARKIYKNQKIQIDDVFAQYKILMCTILTIIINLICMMTYGNNIIRYLLIVIVFGMIALFMKKYRVFNTLREMICQ